MTIIFLMSDKLMEGIEMMDETIFRYHVVDTNSSFVFDIGFYDDPKEYGAGFTFDDPDGNDWLCENLDSINHVIRAEPMDHWMINSIKKYYKDRNDLVPDDIMYGYVETN